MSRRSVLFPARQVPRALQWAATLLLTALLVACNVTVGSPPAGEPAERGSDPGMAATRPPQNQSVFLVTATPGRPAALPGSPALPAAPVAKPAGVTPDVQATIDAALTATLAAAPGAVQTQAPSGAFLESFDDNRNGWFETLDAPAWSVWLEGGEYHLTINEAWEGPAHIAKPWEHTTEPLARQYADVSVQARVRGESGTEGYGGLALCIDDIYTSYYLFVVYADGSWSLEKRLGTEWEELASGRPATGARPVPEANLLQMVRAGSEIRIFANEVPLGTVNDTSLASGIAGVVAGEWREPANSHWTFDDFQVQAPY